MLLDSGYQPIHVNRRSQEDSLVSDLAGQIKETQDTGYMDAVAQSRRYDFTFRVVPAHLPSPTFESLG